MAETKARDREAHKSLRVLFVDDERSLQEFMRSELPRLGHEVVVCPDGHAGLKALEKGTFDAAILDLRMPGMTGIEVLQQLKRVSPETEAVVMTGHASTETAIEALRLGAFDYITKPCKLTEIDAILTKIAERRELRHKNIALETRVQAAEGPTVLVGNSPAMTPVHRLISTVAPTEATVLILGETGTGKDLAARAIWQQSKRSDMPFVPVNCGALAENLVESELFGHRKGAFTGADRDHKGMFEVANGGTLFLDELGELNKNIQVKLLRFLESGEIRRLGDNEPFRLDVRVLCATNRDLRQMIQDEDFREDLYFRINTFELRLPPLRERRPDIPALARHLLARVARRPVEQVADLLTPEAVDVLLDHDWPGNVRELANVMEYAYIMAGGQPITPEHLQHKVRSKASGPPTLKMPTTSTEAIAKSASAARTLEDIEMEHILKVVEKHKGHKPASAEELGISLKTLYNKLNKLEEKRSAG
jgi:DNA-binding NtrC family response regulator